MYLCIYIYIWYAYIKMISKYIYIWIWYVGVYIYIYKCDIYIYIYYQYMTIFSGGLSSLFCSWTYLLKCLTSQLSRGPRQFPTSQAATRELSRATSVRTVTRSTSKGLDLPGLGVSWHKMPSSRLKASTEKHIQTYVYT